jgi:hypothetical protein
VAERFTAGLVDAAGIMRGFDCWSQTVELKWQAPNLQAYLSAVAPKVDAIFLTWRGKDTTGLAEAIRQCQYRCTYVVLAAEYPVPEIVALAKRAGAAGVIRASTRWAKLFEDAEDLLLARSMGATSNKSRTGESFTPTEVSAIKLFKSGTPLLMIGGKVGKDSTWVVNLLAREGLRKA